MRAVLQRVTSAAVRVDGQVVGDGGPGGTPGPCRRDPRGYGRPGGSDGGEGVDPAHPVRGASCDERERPSWSSASSRLYADTRKGRRPSWHRAAPRAVGEPLVEAYVAASAPLGAEVAIGSSAPRWRFARWSLPGPITSSRHGQGDHEGQPNARCTPTSAVAPSHRGCDGDGRGCRRGTDSTTETGGAELDVDLGHPAAEARTYRSVSPPGARVRRLSPSPAKNRK